MRAYYLMCGVLASLAVLCLCMWSLSISAMWIATTAQALSLPKRRWRSPRVLYCITVGIGFILGLAMVVAAASHKYQVMGLVMAILGALVAVSYTAGLLTVARLTVFLRIRRRSSRVAPVTETPPESRRYSSSETERPPESRSLDEDLAIEVAEEQTRVTMRDRAEGARMDQSPSSPSRNQERYLERVLCPFSRRLTWVVDAIKTISSGVFEEPDNDTSSATVIRFNSSTVRPASEPPPVLAEPRPGAARHADQQAVLAKLLPRMKQLLGEVSLLVATTAAIILASSINR